MTIPEAVTPLLERHPAVREVRLVGSRAKGTAKALSDWDFAVQVEDFPAVVRDLPRLVQPLDPLAQQWDRLARRRNYMLILPGPVKIDLLFDEPYAPASPWDVNKATLPRIDDHFWDWIFWVASKHVAGRQRLVAGELAKLSVHLLRPMRAMDAPGTVEEAIACYKAARQAWEERFRIRISTALQDEIERALRHHGFRV